MQKLTGLDGMFLSLDTPTSNGVMGGLIIYDAPDDPTAGSAERMRVRIEERLDAIPPFRWVKTGSMIPVGINNAYWTEVDHVDVAAHIRELTLPAPGTNRQLAAEVAAIMETGLEMDRPLWELVVITGLEGGRLAHLLRIHHGVIDGSTVPLVLDLLSDHPAAQPDPEDARPARHALTGGKLEATARGLASTATAPLRLINIQAKTAKYLIDRRKDDGILALPAFLGRMLPGAVAKPINVLVNGRRRKVGRVDVLPLIPKIKRPDSPFDVKLTPNRSYAFADLPLADFKYVGKAFDATLNDSVVAVCAGALRRYMVSIGIVPDEPLIVCVPSSIRGEEEKERWSNHVVMFFTEFPTHLEDPQARIEALHEDLKAAKENFDALPTHMFRDIMRWVPQVFWNSSVRLMDKKPDWIPGAMWNVVVSNVRGPSKTVEVCGAKMEGYWPAAFLSPGVGLNITLQSYRDRVDFGFMGCSDVIPDLWQLPDFMTEELAELYEVARIKKGDPSRVEPDLPAAPAQETEQKLPADKAAEKVAEQLATVKEVEPETPLSTLPDPEEAIPTPAELAPILEASVASPSPGEKSAAKKATATKTTATKTTARKTTARKTTTKAATAKAPTAKTAKAKAKAPAKKAATKAPATKVTAKTAAQKSTDTAATTPATAEQVSASSPPE